jgi:hypothetical protein
MVPGTCRARDGGRSTDYAFWRPTSWPPPRNLRWTGGDRGQAHRGSEGANCYRIALVAARRRVKPEGLTLAAEPTKSRMAAIAGLATEAAGTILWRG